VQEIDTAINDIMMMPSNVMCDNKYDVYEMTLSRLIYYGILPKWMLSLNLSESKRILNMLYKTQYKGACMRFKYAMMMYKFINVNIKNMDEFDEYVRWTPVPPIVCKGNKFVEYRTLYRQLKNTGSIDKLKEDNIIPEWIDNINTAFTYIYFEYENKYKEWKFSKETFEMQRRELGNIFAL